MSLVVTDFHGIVSGLCALHGYESPCEETGLGHEWITDSSPDGSWDAYCWRCSRPRDWDLDSPSWSGP